MRPTIRLTLLTLLLVGGALGVAACGSSGEDTSEATAPSKAELEKPATGTLRVFAYDDTVTDEQLDPFREANPDLDLKIATFNSNDEAAAKLAGGFEADVVEVCLDEAKPLLTRNQLRPLDTSGIAAWDKLSFRDEPEVTQDGNVIMVPLSAGPYGIAYNTDDIPDGVDSYEQMFGGEYDGRIAIEGGNPVTPLATAALTLGFDDPFNMTDDQLEQAKQFLIDHQDAIRSYPDSDSDMVNLFKTNEAVVANSGRGTALDMIDEGIPVKWVAPEEGTWSWICGLGITSKAKNIDAAYKLINYYADPEAQAISAENGFVITNPDAESLVPAKFKETASPKSIEGSIPLTEPENIEAYTKAWQQVRTG
ncbi:MAG: extracellular solute-binding protein [Solirubrobacterales bacterium]|nr:extracellular solute-binding protein [Solirubrobacterales bacterium]